jgi:soluble lytic murein transglycosylase
MNICLLWPFRIKGLRNYMPNKFFPTISLLFCYAALVIGCSAQTEEQALASIRALTAAGRLPSEAAVLDIENRFANKRTGALARLLRARIKFDSGDFAGSAALLDSGVFRERTKLADHALWLRAKALQSSGNHAEAMNAFARLVDDHADSIRVREARLGWAESAIASGRAADVPGYLAELVSANHTAALVMAARSYELRGAAQDAAAFYRRVYFSAPSSAEAKEAQAKLTAAGEALQPRTAQEQLLFAESLFKAKRYSDSAAAYQAIAPGTINEMSAESRLRYISAMAAAGRAADVRAAVAAFPSNSDDRDEAYRQLVIAYARARDWPQARLAATQMRSTFPNSKLLARTFIDAGNIAREAKNNVETAYFFNTAVAAFPNAPEVAQAQFEAAWAQHEAGNFAASSQMLTEHLARYAAKDTTNRGIAGYWAARDSERAGKLPAACSLYHGVVHRYAANWYGYLAKQRIDNMINQGTCGPTGWREAEPIVAQAVANLRRITVAPETAGDKELERAEKSDELSIVGLFDWAVLELEEAKKTAGNSPKINFALARHYRWKGDNTAAFVALRPSYPDYSQMFPEEMGRDEWEIFYPLTNWGDITRWATARGLDKYQVAGLIRQESVFQPRAKSPANAYGLMQLLLPTAKATARKYGSRIPNSYEELFTPAYNIELGTAYMRDQFDKFGRIEYVAVAYNAGPGRVPQWRASLPLEIDEFVEKIPFKETKAYVQGVVRNTAQYRRLYDENGNFRANVGTRPLRGEIDSKPRDQFTAENPEILVDTSNGE